MKLAACLTTLAMVFGMMPLALGLVWLATRVLPVHPMSRHDGTLSVRRAYAPSELGDLFGAAGVTRPTVTRYPWLARLVVEAAT